MNGLDCLQEDEEVDDASDEDEEVTDEVRRGDR